VNVQGLFAVKQNTILAIGGIVLAGAGIVWASSPSDHDHNQHSIQIPTFSDVAAKGNALFNAHCSACHGKNATGTKQGPPLIHKIYEPSHHGDASFQRAAKNGVRAHHWPFGNMPPVAGVTGTEISHIIAYVRELQRANGIQ